MVEVNEVLHTECYDTALPADEGGLPVHRTDRRELPVGERQQPASARVAGERGMSGEVIAVDVYNLSVGGGGDDCAGEKFGHRARPVRDCLAVRTANTGAGGRGVAVEVCYTLDLSSGQGVLVDYE